jgi:transposase-like protein
VRQLKGHGAKFGRKQEEAITALLTQRNIDEAAKSIGVSSNTLLKWMKQPEFDAAYREARRLAFRQSVARLQQASGAAVSTLLKIMVDQNAPHSTRVRAADSVLDHAAKAIEIEDVEARVSALEASIEAERTLGRK